MPKQIAKGKRGIIFKTKFKGEQAIKKIERKDTQAINRINNEVYWLKKLNKYKIGPKLYSYKNNYFICEFIKGKNIIPFLKLSKNPLKIILNILNQCRILDKLKIDKKEMTNPYKHIIIRKSKPIFIDFERTRVSEKPKNTTSFFQFLTSKKIQDILNQKNISINKEEIKPLLKKYKNSFSEEDFNNLIEQIKLY